ncbi:hypothetical protein HDU76_002786 [Blyttiomyces sp. JEL0837]|nr:hypothetical protein HDU76_002786 [Blyttiomyces sp. JEL0837]
MDYFFGTETPAWKGRSLRVRIGPSLSNLTVYNVNEDSNPQFIDSPYFTGNVAVRVKNFRGVVPEGKEAIADTPYFGTRKRLFSVQVQGRFKHEHTAEDVVFGAEFEHKVNPPTGAWLAIKFANLIDPALITDMYADRPWLYSPMLCSMNIVNVVKATNPIHDAALEPLAAANPPLYAYENAREISMPMAEAVEKGVDGAGKALSKKPDEVLGKWEWGGEVELKEENQLLLPDKVGENTEFASDAIADRRRFFNKKQNREEMIFSPDYVYNLEIFAPFIDFNTFDLTLGINVNLLRYLTNQPIRLICKSLSKNIPFFIVEFDLIEDPVAADGAGAGAANGSSGEETFEEAQEQQ